MTQWMNDDDNYGAIAKALHWVIALLVIGLLVAGLVMTNMPYGPEKLQIYATHKTVGLTVLILAVLRLLWRFASIPPDALESHAGWERKLAGAAHLYLYFAMLALPLTGWLMSNASEYPVPFFGLNVPVLMGKDETLAGLFGQAHMWIAYGLMGVIALHIAGALKHHILDKDSTLKRMAGDKLKWIKLVFVVVLLDLAMAGAALYFIKDALVKVVPNEQGVAVNKAVVEGPDLSTLPDHGWAIDMRESALTFEASMMSTPMTGHFNSFGGDIVFDADNLADSRAAIVIDMGDIVTGDQSRDREIQGNDWFATLQFPQARYVTRMIDHIDGNNYVAVGDLTIRDTSLPVTLPFTLNFSDHGDVRIARMSGQVTIDRRDFGVGQGEWAGAGSVAAPVTVKIDITALQPR